MAAVAIPTNRPHNNLLSALGSMSSLDNGVDIYDSEEYDTDLEDEKEKPDYKPYIGIYAYKESCSRLKVAEQRVVLKSLPEQAMNLSGRNLGPMGMRPVIISLLKNTRVLTLDLSGTGLGDIGGGYIAQLLYENEFVCNLNLSQNSIGAHGVYPVSEVLKYNNALIRLDLSSNKLDDIAAELLAGTIKMNDRLEELDLSNNKIGQGAKEIGAALAKNQSLETLILSWNWIRGEGSLGLIKGLHLNTALTRLELCHNGLGYDGSLALGNMLKKNSTLKYLDISQNNINWQCLLLILPGLKKNKKLEILKIGYNPLTTTGAMDLIEALSGSTCKVSTLSLKNVPVVGEFEMMATAIRQTRPFDYDHGGIVSSHDILGQRYDKQVDPMAKIISYMKDKQLRPAELFRSFDKSVGNHLKNDDFVQRLQGAGLNMPKYEIEQLVSHLTQGNNREGADGFNYKVMIKSVKSQVDKDRTEVIREKERKKKIKDYHKKILAQTTIPEEGEYQDDPQGDGLSISDSRSIKSIVGLLRTASGLSMRGGGIVQDTREVRSSISTPRSTPVLPPLNLANVGNVGVFTLPGSSRSQPSPHTGTKLMSMSGNLGGKVKEFGAHSAKKRKKKKGTKKRR